MLTYIMHAIKIMVAIASPPSKQIVIAKPAPTPAPIVYNVPNHQPIFSKVEKP